MNRLGYTVALPGYRLCPEVSIADIVEDIRAAALHLHRRVGAKLVAVGHSAGGHLAAAAVATDWKARGAPADLLRYGLAVSGLFDLEPLVQTSLNADLHLDERAAQALSPAFWQPPDGVVLEARVGGDESSEYLRQSRLIAERWSAAGAAAHWESLPGANHFTAPAPLADPQSPMVKTLIALTQSVSA
jgi:arylformamidase